MVFTSLTSVTQEKTNDLVIEELKRQGIKINYGSRKDTPDHWGIKASGIMTCASPRLYKPEITLSRGRYYYRVKCFFPIEEATEMYRVSTVWEKEVRAGGDGGCRHPYIWSKEIELSTGRTVVSPKERKAFDSMPGLFKEEDLIYRDDPTLTATRRFITEFDIDSELGLYMFKEQLGKLGEDWLGMEACPVE